MMFGLAQTTTAVWVLADLAFFYKKATEEYKAWAWQFAKKLYTHGMIWAAVAGTWYVFGTWSDGTSRDHVRLAAHRADRADGRRHRLAVADDRHRKTLPGETAAGHRHRSWPKSA